MRAERTAKAPSVARGRPRSEDARLAILSATRALIEEGGYAAATIEAVAARSGVAKTTIYRWWPNRALLAIDVLVQLSGEFAPMPAGHDPLKALRGELRRVGRASNQLPGRLLLSLLSEAERDLDTRAALEQKLFMPRRQATARVIEQAQEEGTVRKEIPALCAVDMLFGPLFYRKFIRHQPATDKFVNELWEYAMIGLTAQPAAPKAAPRARRMKTR
jgi:AcrR family transcriptional regulator